MPPLKEPKVKAAKPLKAAKAAAVVPPKSQPFRHAMFLFAARRHLAAAAVAEYGFNGDLADAFANAISDETIVEAANYVAAKAPKGTVPKVGAGGFFAFLLAILNSPLFAELIALLLSMFAGKPEMIAAIRAAMAAPQPPVVASDPPAADAPPTLVA